MAATMNTRCRAVCLNRISTIRNSTEMKSFAQRLEAAKRRGRLRTSHLQLWFGRPYHTVRGWMVGRKLKRLNGRSGWEPSGPDRAEIDRRLVQLEQAVGNRKYFPIPHGLTYTQQRRHVEGAQRATDRRVPGARASR
jgi:hypothetical protein